MKILIGVLLLLHGLIVAGQSAGSFKPTIGPIGLENPSWVSWWPTRLGQSWFLAWLGLERSSMIAIFGLLWLISGIALVAAGLGVLGFVVPPDWWRNLAVAGGVISLLMLVLYFHPLTIIGTASSLAVLIALLWAKWPPMSLIP